MKMCECDFNFAQSRLVLVLTQLHHCAQRRANRMLTRAYEGRRIDNIALAQARETANRLGVPPSEFQALERGYRNRLIGR